MIRFVSGAVFGFFVATIITLGANQQTTGIPGFFTGAQLMMRNRAVRLGYAAGVLDAYETFRFLTSEQDAALVKQITDTSECLRDRSAGNLDQFTDNAERHWRGRPYGAAVELINNACK